METEPKQEKMCISNLLFNKKSSIKMTFVRLAQSIVLSFLKLKTYQVQPSPFRNFQFNPCL